MQFLAQVRRLEAVSFRSFPSTSTHYDGTWALRLTAGHPAKRLNSVNPLDPSDHAFVDARLELAKRRFESFGRPLVFRQSPLAPRELESLLDDRGWIRFDESIVMMLDLKTVDLSNAQDYVPIKDIGYWVDSFLELSDEAKNTKPGLFEVISSIKPNSGLFVKSVGDERVAAVRCVHDNDLAGIFDLVTGRGFQRQGHARSLVLSALKWAKISGARHAWLQVVAENASARELYTSIGFRELYRYSYRMAPAGS
ncbi:MAG: GNAT family N-acetyltransferase [Rhizobiaceae bacterium]|nr:GNAT family N-acetyltransferase [Rhizobiaceae bacterium]